MVALYLAVVHPGGFDVECLIKEHIVMWSLLEYVDMMSIIVTLCTRSWYDNLVTMLCLHCIWFNMLTSVLVLCTV